MSNPVRIVRRRFYLNEDYIFPPGYFAELYMKITDLDSDNHEFGLWEDSMKFESLYKEGEREYRIGVYIFVDTSSHFDLIVCSTNPNDCVESTPGYDVGNPHPRVWHWLNQLRGFVYSVNCKGSSLVKEWCLDPLKEGGGERSVRDVYLEKQHDDLTIHHYYYYGTCEDRTSVEVLIKEELAAFVLSVERDMLGVGREYTLHPANKVLGLGESFESMMDRIQIVTVQVRNLERELSHPLEGIHDSSDVGKYHSQLVEVAAMAFRLEMELSEKILDEMSSVV